MKLEDAISEFLDHRKIYREKILAEDYTPFENIVTSILQGYFEIRNGNEPVKFIKPTCVEIYYHEEFPERKKYMPEVRMTKDYIVYHRNAPNEEEDLPLFPRIGVLHNHQSGIDITFEHENIADGQAINVRFSALIRGFYIYDDRKKCEKGLPLEMSNFNPNPDDRSTYLYDYFYNHSSVFDGLNIQWCDSDNKIQFKTKARVNVYSYAEDGEWLKKTSKLLDYAIKQTSKDTRPWRYYNVAFYGANGPE